MQTLNQVEVYQSGPLTVIGFGDRVKIDHLDLPECHNEVFELIRNQRAKVLAIDLTAIEIIPSGLLGLLVAVHQQGVSVCLFNASVELREVLEITKLDRLFPTYTITN